MAWFPALRLQDYIQTESCRPPRPGMRWDLDEKKRLSMAWRSVVTSDRKGMWIWIWIFLEQYSSTWKDRVMMVIVMIIARLTSKSFNCLSMQPYRDNWNWLSNYFYSDSWSFICLSTPFFSTPHANECEHARSVLPVLSKQIHGDISWCDHHHFSDL